MRARNLYAIGGLFLVITLWLLSDPDLGLITQLPFGAGLVATIVLLSKGILGPTLLYLTRKAMFDYPVADLEKLGKKAFEHPIGAAIFALAISVMCLAFAAIIAVFVFA